MSSAGLYPEIQNTVDLAYRLNDQLTCVSKPKTLSAGKGGEKKRKVVEVQRVSATDRVGQKTKLLVISEYVNKSGKI